MLATIAATSRSHRENAAEALKALKQEKVPPTSTLPWVTCLAARSHTHILRTCFFLPIVPNHGVPHQPLSSYYFPFPPRPCYLHRSFVTFGRCTRAPHSRIAYFLTYHFSWPRSARLRSFLSASHARTQLPTQVPVATSCRPCYGRRSNTRRRSTVTAVVASLDFGNALLASMMLHCWTSSA